MLPSVGLSEKIVLPNVTDWHQKGLTNKQHSIKGIAIGLTIIGLWAGSLIFWLSWDISKVNIFWIGTAIASQTFLYTGVFITAHDAMHCAIFPQNRQINHLIGRVAVFLYALFSYQKLLKNHWLHHRHPASETDPDFYDSNWLGWYFKFFSRYFSWMQISGLGIIFHVLNYFAIFDAENMFLFWVIPSLLSSVQLFYFGTYLPHREPEGGYTNHHRCQSNSLSTFWSFITCYHFGYHEEHHEYPHLPWWQLPIIRQSKETGFL